MQERSCSVTCTAVLNELIMAVGIDLFIPLSLRNSLKPKYVCFRSLLYLTLEPYLAQEGHAARVMGMGQREKEIFKKILFV